MIKHIIRLGYQSRRWKKARYILLTKRGKRDFKLVKSYRVISLFKCFGKVVVEVVAELLSQYCESYLKLHVGQMRAKK